MEPVRDVPAERERLKEELHSEKRLRTRTVLQRARLLYSKRLKRQQL